MSSAIHDLDLEEQQGQEKFNPQVAREMGKYVLKEKILLFTALSLVFLGTFSVIFEPMIFGRAIDDSIVKRNPERLKYWITLYFSVELIRYLSITTQAFLFERLGQKVMHQLRLDLFSHLQVLPTRVFDKNPAGRLVTRVTNDVAAIAEMFASGIGMVLGNFLHVFGTLIAMLLLSIKMGFIALAVMPVLLLLTVTFSRKLRAAYREARSRLSAFNAYLAENILGMRIVYLFNRQKLHSERLSQINQRYTDAQIGTVRVFAFFQPAITWCSGVSLALVIYFGGKNVLSGEFAIGAFSAYLSYVLGLFQPIREISDKWNVFLSGMSSAERIFSILSWETEYPSQKASKEASAAPSIRGQIRFEGVWFAYDSEHWILQDFNLEIPAGSQVGIVGHTGAGKTTIISLLLRFYEPQKGRILIDGKDIREYDLRQWRSLFGLVQQDVFLFSGSIHENILLWRKNRSLDSQSESLLSLKKDLSTQLEERGANLSVGERQVLAFSRALHADPKIWILDEASAHVDPETEDKLSSELKLATRGKTSFLIAHRLATLNQADQIIVMHKGKLEEQGSHRDLIKKNGLYARLYRYQSVLESQSLVENSTQA